MLPQHTLPMQGDRGKKYLGDYSCMRVKVATKIAEVACQSNFKQ